MMISDILRDKGGEVFATFAWTPVAEVIEQLDDRRVGALVVHDETRTVAGIVSERDIVHGLRTRGAALLELPVDQIMTHHVATVAPDEPLARAMATMTRGRYRHLPVIDRGELIGVVSIGDLVKHRLREMELETGVLRDSFIASH